MYEDYTKIIVKVEDSIGTITLNRPELGNAFAKVSYTEVRDCLEKMSEDDNVRVVVITGNGKHFSAGGDIVDFQRRIDEKTYVEYEGVITAGRMGIAPKKCEKPVIAMINGAAAGAGASLALGCDFRFMTPKSQIKMAFIGLGFPGDTGGAYFLERLVGAGKALEMMMLGEPMYGEEAARLNVAKCVEEGKLAEETYKFAKRLANGPSQGYKWQKQLFLEAFYGDIARVNALEAAGMHATSMSADFAEAVDAFLHKRMPKFSGK